jgi:hypothetical protein
MDDYERLRALARALVAANADVSELFAHELGQAARHAKVGGAGHGITMRVNSLTGGMEIRGGILQDYIDGLAPGGRYEEVKGEQGVVLCPPDIG